MAFLVGYVLILILGCLVFKNVSSLAPLTYEPKMAIVGDNTLISVVSPQTIKTRLQYDIIATKSDFNELLASFGDKKDLISCLIQNESSWNPQAIGDSGLAHGILQFHEPTFQHYCVQKYGLENDIWNPEIQMLCCYNMLQEGLQMHWSTFPVCK